MPKILIVEDDASIREAFSIILKINSEYDVSVAENGQVALELCRVDHYDLILLDIMMPIMDGPTFLKEYSTLYPNDISKIIIMSNLSSGSELSIVQDLGVDKSVLKSSLTPQRLMTIVADGLKERSGITQELNDAKTLDNDMRANETDERPINDSY